MTILLNVLTDSRGNLFHDEPWMANPPTLGDRFGIPDALFRAVSLQFRIPRGLVRTICPELHPQGV